MRNQRVNDLLVHNGKQPCLWITPLKNEYEKNERIDIEHAVFSARALRFSVPSKEELREVDGATWIWSATSAGLLSRRTDSVGRHDGKGVSYANLNARKISVKDGRIYALEASGGSREKRFHGALLAVNLDESGRLQYPPIWKGKVPGANTRDAMIVSGTHLFVGSHRFSGESEITRISAADGKLLSSFDIPSRMVRDGLAAAYGNLYVCGVDGIVRCYGSKP